MSKSDVGEIEELVERARCLLGEFNTMALEKMELREVEYGYLVGDTPFTIIFSHLVDEFAEVIRAVEANTSFTAYGILSYLKEQLESKMPEGDIAEELGDVMNLCKVCYVCGKVQGVF